MHTFITNKLKKELSFCLFQFNCYDFFRLEGRPVFGAVRKFKCPLKKTQPFCPCSSALNWTGKGLSIQTHYLHSQKLWLYRRHVHKTAKSDSSFVSVCMQQLGSHWMDFYEVPYFSIFVKYVKKFQVSLKSEKNNRYFT